MESVRRDEPSAPLTSFPRDKLAWLWLGRTPSPPYRTPCFKGTTSHTPDRNCSQHSLHPIAVFLRPAELQYSTFWAHIQNTLEHSACNTQSCPDFSTLHKAVTPCRCNYTSQSSIVRAYRVCPLFFFFLICGAGISDIPGWP